MICVLVAGTLTSTQFATADYRITNGSATEPAFVVYSRWLPASGNWPAGWRTDGYYKVEPGGTRNLSVPQGDPWVYIYVERGGSEIKPVDHATRDSAPFWIHPSKAFTVVETTEGDFLKSNRGRWSLETATLYEYRNGGSHTIPGNPRLPELLGRQIYAQAMDSVVWIQTITRNGSFGKGSGVLIDKDRRLIVTNEHVIRGATDIYVFFPWRDQQGVLNKKEDFYFENLDWLADRDYVSNGRVVAQHVRNDLAIVQLDQLSPTAREIKHDFSKNVEDSMKKGDAVHILGNPGNRLWNWTKGDFLRGINSQCLPSGGPCLVMEGDIHGGNSGGPVLNGQGTLVGIITATDNETEGYAAPSRNIRALLNTVPANLDLIGHPREVFRIRNNTRVTVPYQIRWSSADDWEPNSIDTGFIKTHWSSGQRIVEGYPKIRFDHIAGDQVVTYRGYNLDTALFREGNNNHAPTYFFQFNRWGDRLDLYIDDLAAPMLSEAAPKETVLLSNYPNPFNPETWIPYQLAKPAEVTVTIYAADGKLVRRLALGHQPAGVYQSKSRAAYWDGKNDVGESVASGLYFYTLKAGEFTATRKMLIRK